MAIKNIAYAENADSLLYPKNPGNLRPELYEIIILLGKLRHLNLRPGNLPG
jgi:hypothetical protein